MGTGNGNVKGNALWELATPQRIYTKVVRNNSGVCLVWTTISTTFPYSQLWVRFLLNDGCRNNSILWLWPNPTRAQAWFMRLRPKNQGDRTDDQ